MIGGIVKFAIFFSVVCSLATTTTVSIGRFKEKQRFDQASKEEPIFDPSKEPEDIDPDEEEDEPVITYTHLDYFIESLTNMKYLEADIDASITYDTYAVDLSGSLYLDLDIGELSNTKAKVDLNIGFENKNYELGVTYVDSTVYLDIFENHIMMGTTSISEIVDLIASFDIPLSLPEEIANLDTTDLLNRLGSMETNEYSDCITYKFNLFDNQNPILFTSDLNHKLTGISTDGISLMGITLILDANTEVLDEEKAIVDPNTKYHYVNLSGYFGIIKDITDLLDSKQFGVNFDIFATNKGEPALSLIGAANVDYGNMDIALDANIVAPKMDSTLFARYVDENIYVNYNDTIKLCYTKTGIGDLIQKINSNLNIDAIDKLGAALSSVTIPLVNLIKNKQYGELISLLSDHISIKDSEIVVTIPNDLLLGVDDEIVTLSLNTKDSHLEGITITNFALDKYLFNLSFDLVEYVKPTAPSEQDLSSYSSLSPINGIIDNVFELINTRQFAFGLEGSVQIKNDEPITFKGDTQFDLDVLNGGGHIAITDAKNRVHNVDIDVYDIPTSLSEDSIDESSAKMYFAYNNKFKGSFALKDLRDLISLVSNLLNSDEERWKQYTEAFTNGPLFTLINEAKAGNYENLLQEGLIKSFILTDSALTISIDGSLLGQPDTYVNATIGYSNGKLQSLRLQSNILEMNLDITLTIGEFKQDYRRLDINDDYIDFSDIKVLADYLLQTAQLDCFHITGTLDINIQELSFVNKKANLDLYVGIAEDEAVYVKGKLYNIPTMPLVNWKDDLDTKDKYLDFYYDGSGKKESTNYVYLYSGQKVVTWNFFQTEYRDNYVKVDSQTFINNILYYLCGFGLGLSNNILNAMSTTKERTTPLRIENLINDFAFNTESTNWYVNLNLKELADNDSMGDLKINLYGREDGYLSRIIVNTAISAIGIVTINLKLDATLNIDDTEFPYDDFYKYVNAHKDDVNAKEYSYTHKK